MSLVSDTILYLLDKEKQNSLDLVRIKELPLWPLFKYDLRRKYIIGNGIVENIVSKKNKISLLRTTKGLLQSFCQFHKIILNPHPVNNLFMGFSRLDKVYGKYMDIYIDPIIEEMGLQNNYIYFEYGRVGNHVKPRFNSQHVCYTDYIYFVSTIKSIIESPFYLLLHLKEISSFQKKIEKAFGLKISLLYLSRRIREFYSLSQIYSYLLKKLKVKRVFGVSKIVFIHVAFAAKKRGIKVYELQHGITLGPTDLYSGTYNPEIDPDLFLLFGKSCPLNVFGVPENKTMNIGWAFNKYVKKFNAPKNKNAMLVISEPQISNEIIDVVISLAEKYSQWAFHIRRHPFETFTEDQKRKFSTITNIEDVSSDENSFAVLASYDYVLGENSSVLFEALSLGKKVARLSYAGFTPSRRTQDDGFYYLESPNDLQSFIDSRSCASNKEVYSEFSKSSFLSLLN